MHASVVSIQTKPPLCGFFHFKDIMQDESISAAAAKAAPPAIVTSASIFLGFTLNDWVAIATLIYVGLQTFFLLKDRLRKRKEKRRQQ